MTDKRLDRIRGCLIGGAAGDALGYEVEFWSEKQIFRHYGKEGIRRYELDHRGKAVISDDTQMTLYTACGLLNAVRQQTDAEEQVKQAYLEWFRTQVLPFAKRGSEPHVTRLWEVPELFACRAPGNTCLSALRQIRAHGVANNNSKGCGGVMRVAPVGLYRDGDIEEIDALGAACAKLTHRHPMGYIPGAVLAHLVHRAVFPKRELSLYACVEEACGTAERLFGRDAAPLTELLDRAALLSRNSDSDLNNIRRLGEGWVGDEALAIAVYCCLRYENDFSAALIASVNHKGDSDSTGAIAGNILGARLGYDAIDAQWKEHLELSGLMLSLADELYQITQS